jgi:small subunit ribosomal protein S13
MRIHGVEIPIEKRIDIALTYLYGIGRNNVRTILDKAQIDGAIRVKNLTEEQQNRIQRVLDEYKIEGDLRAEVTANIRRLKEIASYRGMRHSRNLPVRGQRTRSNARTKRGKRVTIGAIKKEIAMKLEAAAAAKGKSAPAQK